MGDKKQMSFRDLMKRGEDDNDDNDDEDKPQNFYAGSGLNIQGGGKDLVSSIVNKAKLNAMKHQGEEQGKASGSAFAGKPRILYENAEAEDDKKKELLEEQKVRKVVLVFWSNGFSVSPEGLPSRFFPGEDPRSQRILRNIQMGLAPLKEFGMESGMDVNMQIDDSHRSIPFDEAELKSITCFLLPPEAKPNVFNSGQGQKLASSSSSAIPAAAEWPSFPINSSQPTTRLQIRFGENQRKIMVVNKSTPLSQVVRYLREQVPLFKRIMVGVPAKELENTEGSLEQHQLLDSILTLQ